MTSAQPHHGFRMTAQPDDTTCGPACLHAVYRYYGDEVSIDDVIHEAEALPDGGTLAVHLGRHALGRGYDATIYTCDLQTFDPTWFQPGAPALRDSLLAQARHKVDPKLQTTSRAYVDYLERGGRIHMDDITPTLLNQHLSAGTPLIVGLSATWLYRSARERPHDNRSDAIAGEPAGHFVVVVDLDLHRQRARVADPWPGHETGHLYEVSIHRLIAAILLGIVTYDAKVLIVTPRDKGRS